MGNEMGNNNTTGFKEEEENLRVEDSKELLSPKENFDQENHNDKVEDVSIDKQIPKEEDKEGSGDFLHDTIEQTCLCNSEAEDENLIELNMDEIVPSQLETQTFSVLKESLSLDPMSSSSDDDQVPEKPVVSENDQIIGSGGGTGQASRSSSTCSSTATKELDDLQLKVSTETNDIIEAKLDESIVEPEKEAREEKELFPEEKFELSDFGEKSPNGSWIQDFSLESKPKARTENSEMEARETEEKFVLLPAQATGKVEPEKEVEEEKELFPEEKLEPSDFGKKSKGLSSPKVSSVREFSLESEPKAVTENSHLKAHETEENLVLLPAQAAIKVEPEKEAKEEELYPEEKFEPSDSGEKSSELSSTKVCSIRTLSSESEPKAKTENSHMEAHETEEKFVLLPAQATAKDNVSCREQKDLVSPFTDSDQTLTSQQDMTEIIVSMNEVTTQPETKASSVERVSTDSDRDSVQYAQMRKSPSFSINLQDEEESDQTPLLFEDKAEIKTESLTLVNNGHSDQDQTPIMTLERSDSDKSQTPFLEKEEEEKSHIVASPIHNNNNNVDSSSSSIKVTVTSSSIGNKEKRKFRPSLFVNCMCCAAVIN